MTAERTPEYVPDYPTGGIVGRLLQDGALEVAALNDVDAERVAHIFQKWSKHT